MAAGTSTKDLTGLTSGGTYTYSAYSASGCAEANQLASAASFTTGVVSVSNLDETANDTGVGITSAFTEATGFTTGDHGDGYRLRSVTIKSGAATGSPGAFTAAIHAASAGNPAASATYTLSGDRPTAAGNHAYTCAGACQLSGNTTYFLVLSMGSASSSAGADSGAGIASSADSYVWNVTDSDDETNSPSAAGWSIANVAKYQRNVTWTDEADGATGMFKVTATENPSLSAGSITTTGATLAMANYAGIWHYKADAGPDTACQGPVSATTQAVTGLTSGRTYTYSAYSASGCADADLVATVEFAAGPVSVSNLDEASDQSDWWDIGSFSLGNNYASPMRSPSPRAARPAATRCQKSPSRSNWGMVIPLASTRKSTRTPAGCPERWSRTSAAETPRQRETIPGPAPATAATCRRTPPTTWRGRRLSPLLGKPITTTGFPPIHPPRPTRPPMRAGRFPHRSATGQ